MRKFAQIYNDKAWWIFESEEIPEFAPDIIILDITNTPEVQEGWDYDSVNETFSAPVITNVPNIETIEDKIAQLKADNLILMDVLATMYEDMLLKGTV